MPLLRHWLLAEFAAVVGANCTYHVVTGDNCWAIATSKFDITLNELYRLNPNIKDANCPIFPGDPLNVPCTKPRQLVAPRLDDQCTEVYIVQPGDYCHKISVDKSMSLQHLVQWNRLSPPYMIWPGKTLCISKFEPVECSSRHAVDPGDTCFALAARAGISLDNLIQLNPNLMSYQCSLLPEQRVCLKGTAMGKRDVPKSTEPSAGLGEALPPSIEHGIVIVMNNFVGNWTDSTPPPEAELMPSMQELNAAIQMAEKSESSTTKLELGLTRDLAGVLQS